MLYVDIPTQSDLKMLVATRDHVCVSIFVSTTAQTQHVGASRIAFANLAKQALQQISAVGIDKRRLALLEAEFSALREDEDFWRTQANSLAVLATPDKLRTYRLATSVSDRLEVSDRFYLKPLMRALAFPQHAFVLALSENAARLVEIFPDHPPQLMRISDLPDDAASAANRASINNLSQNTRIANAEGEGVLLRQYARKVNAAIGRALAGRSTPLILAATQPLAPIFRAASTLPTLLDEGIVTSPDRLTDADLASEARKILDVYYANEIKAAVALYETRFGDDRATADLSRAARAATFGAIDTLLVDIEQMIPGRLDDADGSLTLLKEAGPASYDVVDEIASRAFASGARVLAVRTADLPGGGPVAAILRYSV